jgi:hypothetical protein
MTNITELSETDRNVFALNCQIAIGSAEHYASHSLSGELKHAANTLLGSLNSPENVNVPDLTRVVQMVLYRAELSKSPSYAIQEAAFFSIYSTLTPVANWAANHYPLDILRLPYFEQNAPLGTLELLNS